MGRGNLAARQSRIRLQEARPLSNQPADQHALAVPVGGGLVAKQAAAAGVLLLQVRGGCIAVQVLGSLFWPVHAPRMRVGAPAVWACMPWAGAADAEQ